MRDFFKIIFFFAVFSASVVCANERLGMNAHLVFDCSINFANELCVSMKDAGVQIVRLDVYWTEKDWLQQKKALDKACFYADKNGLKILLSIPQIPEKMDSTYIERWLEMLSYYAERYDGKKAISIDDEFESRFVKVDFFELMNEPDLKIEKLKMDVPVFYSLMRKASERIKLVREDAKIVMPGLTNTNHYTKDFLQYRSVDGKSLADIVDVTNLHFYNDDQKKYIAFLDEWLDLIRKNRLGEKRHWVTECGASLWEYSQLDQAKLLPKQNIVVLSKGFDKVFYYQFHAFGGNRAPGIHHQRQNYYGIIGPSVSNSYGSFYVNDGEFRTAITSGDASKRIYLRKQNKDNFMLYSHSKTTLWRLKTKGVAIGGRGYTLKSVSLLHKDGLETELWKGMLKIDEEEKTFLKLPATSFWGMDKKDKICVRVDSVADLEERWTGLDPWLAYNAYKALSFYYTPNSSVPQIEKTKISKLNIYSWISPERGKVWAVWADDGEKIKIQVATNGDTLNIVDHFGNKVVNRDNELEITDALVYISGTSVLNVRRI